MLRALSGAHILKQIRDRGPLTLTDLANILGTKIWNEKTSDVTIVGPSIQVMFDAGLIRIRRVDGSVPDKPASWQSWDPSEALLECDDKWTRVQAFLSISLSELAMKQAGTAMTVEPIFGSISPRETSKSSADVHVLMPFSDVDDDVFAAIHSTVSECGLLARRSDAEYGERGVVDKIWRQICGAKMIVADLTGQNPNVFYELGLAHVVGVPTILISQYAKDVPIDIRHLDIIGYHPSPQGLRQLGIQLGSVLRNRFRKWLPLYASSRDNSR
jgi:hypothetical protein